jgi:hypothetical protein
MQAMGEDGTGFRSALEKDNEVMSRIGPQMGSLFDPWTSLEHTDLAYDRLGLGTEARKK